MENNQQFSSYQIWPITLKYQCTEISKKQFQRKSLVIRASKRRPQKVEKQY